MWALFCFDVVRPKKYTHTHGLLVGHLRACNVYLFTVDPSSGLALLEPRGLAAGLRRSVRRSIA